MRVSLLAALVLGVAAVADAGPITVMNVPIASGGGVSFNNDVIGNEILMGYSGSALRAQPPTPSGLLQQFSFFFTDPGAGSSALSFKTGIVRTTGSTSSFIDPSNVVYESDWQTVASDGTMHRLDTNVNVMLNAGERFLFYIMTAGYAGPSWQIQTNRTLAMAQASAPEHPDGAYGLRAGGGYSDWVDPLAPGARFLGFNYDADAAMMLTVESVPEPSSLLLLGLGSLGLLGRKRR